VPFSSWQEQQSSACAEKWNRRLFVLRDHVETDAGPCSINKYIQAPIPLPSPTLHFFSPIPPPITLSLPTLSLVKRMASNDNNNKRKLEEAEISVVRKRLWLSNDDGSNDDSSNSHHEDTEEEEEVEETEEEVSSEESSMNQVDTSEDKLVSKHGSGLFFSDDGDTTSSLSEPCTLETPSSHVRSDPDDSDDDNFWMKINPEVPSISSL
jgi:hypothetical protein